MTSGVNYFLRLVVAAEYIIRQGFWLPPGRPVHVSVILGWTQTVPNVESELSRLLAFAAANHQKYQVLSAERKYAEMNPPAAIVVGGLATDLPPVAAMVKAVMT